MGPRRARRHRPGDDRRPFARRGPRRPPDDRGEPDGGRVPRPGLAGPLPAYPPRPAGQPRGRQLGRGARPGHQRRGAGRLRGVADDPSHGLVDDRRPRRARGRRRAGPPVGAAAYAGHARPSWSRRDLVLREAGSGTRDTLARALARAGHELGQHPARAREHRGDEGRGLGGHGTRGAQRARGRGRDRDRPAGRRRRGRPRPDPLAPGGLAGRATPDGPAADLVRVARD